MNLLENYVGRKQVLFHVRDRKKKKKRRFFADPHGVAERVLSRCRVDRPGRPNHWRPIPIDTVGAVLAQSSHEHDRLSQFLFHLMSHFQVSL